MSEHEQDTQERENLESHEQGHDEDALDEQREQWGKGYGEDEGERDESFDE